MDVYKFISSIIDSIAWPLVTLIVCLTFRRQLTELLPWIKKVKAGPVEAEFEIEARTIRDTSKKAFADSFDKEHLPITASQEAEVALAKIYSAKQDPVKMIYDGWQNMDGALFRFGKDAGILIDPMDSADNIYKRVISTDLLMPKTKELVMEIYEMRNRVVQANIKPSLSSAKDYLLAVEQVVKLIEKERETVPRVANVSW